MISKIVTKYLLDKGMISEDQALLLADELTKVRAKLGLIAVHEGLMTEYQADTVNMLQATMDKKFGDLAVEKGFLTNNQVQELLRKQGDPYLSVAQALENLGIMHLNDLNFLMKRYQAENELSASSIELLKTDDIERIVPIFMPADADEYKEFAILAIKTIMRLVDNDLFLKRAYMTEDLSVNRASLQFIDGDPCMSIAICGDDDNMLEAARIFGQEDFPCVNMDALDALAEMINCISGLHASEVSLRRIHMELYPPDFSDNIAGITGYKMLVFPMKLKDQDVNLVICVGEKLEFR